MSQLTISMVNCLSDMTVEKLMNLELIFKRVRVIKGLISQKEKEIKSLDERLLGTLYAIIGKSGYTEKPAQFCPTMPNQIFNCPTCSR